MKFKNILIYSGLIGILSLSACSKKTSIENETPESPPKAPTAYAITETFESGTKGAYALDSVQLLTGNWTFNDGLIGNLPADAKNGTKSVRLRAGYLSMNFDIAGTKVLYVSHAKYGADANSTWQLLASTDGGKPMRSLATTLTKPAPPWSPIHLK